ncbi:MAG: ferritin [Candidatus Marinimicrobia bacterium]|nr:ferritin [Candidatus Neomarinimicrobiota bacterium]
MLKKKIEKALNEQVNKELFSAYLYQSMAAQAEHDGLEGVANWMDVQAEEEMFHARKIYDYINEQGGRVVLEAIEKPEAEYESIKAMFEASLEHEQFITKSINDLVDLAKEENDHATEIFLQWYVTEQVEEEDNVGSILDKFELIGDAGNGIFMIDKELATRTFTPEEDEE